MVISTFAPVVGGAELQAQRVSQALIAHGWATQVLTRRHSESHPLTLSSLETIEGVPVTRLYSRGGKVIGGLLYTLGGLWHLLCHGRGSIYHAHDVGASAWVAVLAGCLLGGRSVVKLRSGYAHYRKRYSRPVRHLMFSALLRLADRVVVVNEELEEMVRGMGIPGTRVVRIPNGVDTNSFYPVTVECKEATRNRLGLPSDKVICVYLGRFQRKKGVDILVRGWAVLPKDVRARALLVLVGGGAQSEGLRGLIASLNIQDSVRMVAFKSSVRDYYWASDVFVLPSRTEGLSNAMIEAMACGLAVVASNVGGSAELVKEGVNGVTFASENVNELAQRVHLVVTKGRLRSSLGEQARRTVTTRFRLEATVDQIQEVYQALG